MTKAVVTPIVDRLLGKFLVGDGCWEWIAGKNDSGYGQIASEDRGSNRRPLRAHRVLYELLRGPIPEGMTVDHLCRNRACVNPWHLEVVSIAENVRRGLGGEAARQRAAERTHCKRGHPFSPENTGRQRLVSGSVARVCRTCRRELAMLRRRRVQPSES